MRVTDLFLDWPGDLLTVGASEAGRSTPFTLRWGEVAGDGLRDIADGLQVNTTMYFASNTILVALVISEVNDGKGFRLEVAASALSRHFTALFMNSTACALFRTILYCA